MIETTLEFLQPTPKYRELSILMELESRQKKSQKKIASMVGLAPSMVNSYIKSFVQRGFLECTGENHRKMVYVVTPEGQKWKMELLMQFMNETILLYKAGKKEFRQKLHKSLKKGMQHVILYGASDTCELVMNTLGNLGVNVVAVVDSDPRKQGTWLNGLEIKHPSEIVRLKPDSVIITSLGHSTEIYSNICGLEDLGIKVQKF